MGPCPSTYRADECAGPAPDLLHQRRLGSQQSWPSELNIRLRNDGDATVPGAGDGPAKPPFRLSRTPQRTGWKRHASRSEWRSPSLAAIKRARCLPARSSRAWSASSAHSKVDGTGPLLRSLSLRAICSGRSRKACWLCRKSPKRTRLAGPAGLAVPDDPFALSALRSALGAAPALILTLAEGAVAQIL